MRRSQVAWPGNDQHALDDTRDEAFGRVEIITMIPEEFRYQATPALFVNRRPVTGAAVMTLEELRISVGEGELGLLVEGWKALDFAKGNRLEVNFVRLAGSG